SSSSYSSCPTSTQLRCGSTGPPTQTSSSRSVDTGGSSLTVTRPLVRSGRLTTSPNAPSSLCRQSSTTVRLKFGSLSCGIDSRNAGANESEELIAFFCHEMTKTRNKKSKRARDGAQVVYELLHLPA